MRNTASFVTDNQTHTKGMLGYCILGSKMFILVFWLVAFLFDSGHTGKWAMRAGRGACSKGQQDFVTATLRTEAFLCRSRGTAATHVFLIFCKISLILFFLLLFLLNS